MFKTITSKTIEVLRNLFESYELPEEIVSDNGPELLQKNLKILCRVMEFNILEYHLIILNQAVQHNVWFKLLKMPCLTLT
ncbi:hypothetical protein HOLleu_05774 [Holothuria leucospilota]|uniref:Integrase catalytic domain-containing protein n=1 Tax=Holothuria leucospilota TaxID=206669 RepID=A0A9Q1CL69_HOLLE|nr:hypothetical protein HOLleu_05774 [Holothuria leucospilota]